MASLTQDILQFMGKDPVGLTESDRVALLHASYKLTDTLENAGEKILELWGIYDPIVLRVAIDLDLFDVVLAHDGPISLDDLAEKTKADRFLIQRVVRILVTNKFLAEQGVGLFSATPFTAALATGSPLKSAVVHITHLYQSDAHIPDFLAARGYKNPTDAFDTPGNLAFNYGKDQTYFDFVAQPGNERLADAFNRTMELERGLEDESFMNEYPTAQRLSQEDPNRVLFVDVGGGLGHQVVKFRKTYYELSGKLVLQDLPEVIEKATEVPHDIIKIRHDFFKPQPESVKGAKAFYLRSVLHDWPEKQARQILSNIVDAMADDSVVLIQESIIPESEVDPFAAKLDWHMMNFSALERTERQWTELADSVGLTINNIWRV